MDGLSKLGMSGYGPYRKYRLETSMSLRTLEQELGEDFIQDVKDAWTPVDLPLAGVMRDGGKLANGLNRKIARFISSEEKKRAITALK